MNAEPVGTICVVTVPGGRYTNFWISVIRQLAVPPSPVNLDIRISSLNVARTRNEALRAAKGDWIWFLDDDHEWDPHTLERLLARNVDVVAPVVLKREDPFGPVHMIRIPEEHRPPNQPENGWGAMALMPGESGLVPVDAVGGAGLLIRRRVWEAMEPPWFTCGQMGAPDVLSEDVAFCAAAKAAGFQPYVDIDETLTHFMLAGIEPVRGPDGEWATCIKIGGTKVLIPAAQPKIQIPKPPKLSLAI